MGGVVVLANLGAIPKPPLSLAQVARIPGSPFAWGSTLAGFALGLSLFILNVGVMRSLANGADGRPAGIRDLGWGFRHGTVWLLGMGCQVAVSGLFAVPYIADRLRATGHSSPLGFMSLYVALLIGVFVLADIVGLIAAAVARFDLPASGALGLSLRSFRAGRRRYLFLAPPSAGR